MILMYHHEVILSPNSFLFGDYFDGLKNYYTPLYHILYDESYSRFGGMNCPYGEQIVFADAQPLISAIIKFISANIIDISSYTVGILNFLMFLSIPVSALILSAVFEKLKVGNWKNILASVFMALLAPQIFRISGHYALAYSFVIPLAIWFWLWQQQKPSYKKDLVIGLSIALASLIHFYFFALMAFGLALAHLVNFLTPKRPLPKQFIFSFLGQIVLPFFLLQVWLALTDSVTDRPNSPYGFLAYRAFWESIFLPVGKPLGTFINHNITQIREVSWEGIAYVGLPASLFTVFYLVALPIKKFRITGNSQMFSFNIAAVLLLLFAMGFPFLLNLQWLVDYTGPLKQFRGIGRFGWIFYYAISIACFLWIFKRHWPKIWQSVLFYGFVISIMIYEVNVVHSKPFYQQNSSAGLYQKNTIVNANEFDAILPIPFFHTGSENIWYGPEGSAILKYSFETSIQTGLPILGVQMSRTSLSQTIKSLKLVYNQDSIPPTISLEENYLLVKEKSFEPSGFLNSIYSQAKLIQMNEDFELLQITGQEIADLKQPKFQNKESLTTLLSNDFEGLESSKTYNNSKGALEANMNQYTKLFEHSAKDSAQTVLVTFQYYLNQDVNPTVQIIEEKLNAQNEVTSYNSFPVFQKIKYMGNWAKIEFETTISKGEKLQVNLQKNSSKPRKIWVDELRIFQVN